MSRKPSTKARVSKVKALAARAGMPGEMAAAVTALQRLSASAVTPKPALRVVKLDATVIKTLKPPATGNTIYWDAEVAGFGCRVTVAGARSFIFNYRVRGSGQQRSITIGAVGSWATSAARNEAKRLDRLVDSGADPRGDRQEQREAPTVIDLCDRFEREYLPRKRPSTILAYRGILNKHVRPFFGGYKRISDVGYEDIDGLHRRITAAGSNYIANRCIAVLSKMFSLALKWEWCAKNPCKGIERNPESKRKRYLTGEELKRLTNAVAETPDRQFATIVGLLILTGARKSEVLGMKWSDLTLTKNRSVWTKLGSTTKQASDHVVPLSEPAHLLLSKVTKSNSTNFVFPSEGKTGHIVEIKKGWAALCQRAGIENLRLHDLRHTFASQLVSSGASLPLIGALLGHSNPSTTARYAHLFDDPQRAAVEKLGEIIGNANGHSHD